MSSEHEYRPGTPTVAMHRAHGRVTESGEFTSAWGVEGEPLPRVTFDGEAWFVFNPPAARCDDGQTVLMLWTSSGAERWRPLDPDTFGPIGWLSPASGAVPLRAGGEGEVRAWMCAGCLGVYCADSPNGRRFAEECCGVRACQWGDGCAETAMKSRVYCAAHQARAEADVERETFEKAEKTTGDVYVGWVFSDVDPKHPGDGYYPSVADLLERCREYDLAPPAYAWACEELKPSTSAEEVIEQCLDGHREDASSEVSTMQERVLQAFLDMWWRDVGVTSQKKRDDLAVVLAAAPVTADVPTPGASSDDRDLDDAGPA